MDNNERLHELIDLIQQWGRDRKIIQNGTAEGQWLKLVSEFGEMADNVAKGNPIDDDIGDQFVVVCMIMGIAGGDWDMFWHEYEMTSGMSIDNDMAGAICETLIELQDLYYMMDRSSGASQQCAYYVRHLEWIAKLADTNLTACVEQAYEEIKDRKGELKPNGVFVKE